MKREHKAFLGFILIFVLIITYAYLATAAGKYGIWFWLAFLAIVAVNVFALVRFPIIAY